MSQYTSWEDFNDEQEKKYAVPGTTVISSTSLDTGPPVGWTSSSPFAYPLRKTAQPHDPTRATSTDLIQQYEEGAIGTAYPGGAVSESWVDDFFLWDLIGNALWGFGESFVVPTVMDVASGGKLRSSFGSQDWKDESWAGKIGYLIGTGAGLLTGIGAIGKGLSWGSRAWGAGSKQVTKRLVSKVGVETGKTMADDVALDVVTSTRRLIDDAGKTAKSELSWGTKLNPFSQTKSMVRYSPLTNPQIYDDIAVSVRKELGEHLGLREGDEALEKIVTSVLKESQESMTKHFGHSIAYNLMQRGWNPKVAQLTGDVVYEAALLGLYDLAIGEAGDMTAMGLGLTEEQWHFEAAWKRAVHGMKTGAILAPIRYIPGGKAVQFGKTGMVADIGHISRLIRANFKGVEKYSDKQLMAMINTLIHSSGNTKMFSGTGISKSFMKELNSKLANMKKGTKGFVGVSPSERIILDAGFKKIRSEIPSLIRTMSGEILKDGLASFTRASVGSYFMNRENYHMQMEQGLWMTEDYPLDKFLVDHFVGMLYMKRGKSFGGYNPKTGEILPQTRPLLGGDPVGRFYSEMGFESNGGEVSRMTRALSLSNRSEEALDIYNRFLTGDIKGALEQSAKSQELSNVDAIQVVEKVRENFIKTDEYYRRKNTDETVDDYKVQIQGHVSEMKDKVRDLNKAGKKEEARAVELEIVELQGLWQMAIEIENMALFGQSGVIIQPMTRTKSLEYLYSLKNIKLKDGTLLTPENFNILEDRMMETKLGVGKEIEDLVMGHLNESLVALGLLQPQDAIVSGKLVINKSLRKAIVNLQRGSSKELYEATNALLELIDNAKLADIVEVSEKGQKVINQNLKEPELIQNFVELWNRNTEAMHEIIYNSVSAESNWRHKVSGWSRKDGFKDPDILGSRPIWESIKAAHSFRRNDLAYYSFSHKDQGVGRELYDYVQNYLGGNTTFKLVAGKTRLGEEHAPIAIDAEIRAFYRNVNSTLKLFDLGGQGGEKKITVSELETIKERVERDLGNVFTQNAEFNSFNSFVVNRHVKDITNNLNVTSGLKQFIKFVLNPESTLSVRMGGKLQIRSTKALRETLLNLPGQSNQEKSAIDKILNEYYQKVEKPLLKELGNNSEVQFMDHRLDTSLDHYSAKDLLHQVQEGINKAGMMSIYDLGSFNKSFHDLSMAVGELSVKINQVPDGAKVNKDIAQALHELVLSGKSLETMITLYGNERDVIGLRFLLDRKDIIEDLANRVSIDDGKTSRSIIEYKKTLDQYIKDALIERDYALGRIDDIDGLDSYIQDRINRMSLENRSGRPKQGNTSVSAQAYETNWGLNIDFLDNLIYNPRKALDSVDLLRDQAYYQDVILKNPSLATQMLDGGMKNIVKGINTVEQFINIVLEPFVKSQKSRIKALGDKAHGTYEEFVLDTYYVVQSALGGKKVALAQFENGSLKLGQTTVSNWDVGINKLSRTLGLSMPGGIILFGEKVGASRGFTSVLSEATRNKIIAELEKGTFTSVADKNILKTGDVELLDMFKKLLVGTGQNATTEFIPIQLDEKTMILIPSALRGNILDKWVDPKGDLRNNLAGFISMTEGISMASAELKVQNYLKSKLGATFDNAGQINVANYTNDKAATLVMLTRLMTSPLMPKVVDIVNNKMSVKDSLSGMKYIKMDSAKGGLALNERTLTFAREFLPRLLDRNSKMWHAFNVFKEQTFDSRGNIKPRRDLNIFDEGGDKNGYFHSNKLAREQLTKDIAENNPQLKALEVEQLVTGFLEGYENLPASVVNGSKWLSTPEMIATLFPKGAPADWFIWGKDKNGKDIIVGFNVTVKPIEMFTELDVKNGIANFSIGKTAYHWSPEMDFLMKDKNGVYYIDAIGFESTHKIHKSYNKETRKLEDRGIVIDRKRSNDFMNDLIFDENAAITQIMEVKRDAIFIKSINGKHDAVVSSGFGNLLGNKSLRDLNAATGVNDVINDLVQRYAVLGDNPFAFKRIVTDLKNFQKDDGNNISKVVGIEHVLQANGLPLFEFMLPQIDKMLASEYLGVRNLISSSVRKGSNSIMVPTGGLSLPQRKDNVQFSFGGSGMSHHEWGQSIGDLWVRNSSGKLSYGSNEGISFVFKVTRHFLEQYNLPSDLVPVGSDIMVTYDGKVLSPHLSAEPLKTSGELVTRDGGIKTGKSYRRVIKDFESAMVDHMLTLVELASNNPHMETIGDLALWLDGQAFVGSKGNQHKDYILNSKGGTERHNENAAYNLFTRPTKETVLKTEKGDMIVYRDGSTSIGGRNAAKTVYIAESTLLAMDLGNIRDSENITVNKSGNLSYGGKTYRASNTPKKGLIPVQFVVAKEKTLQHFVGSKINEITREGLDQQLFSSIHIGKVDLRQPKNGLNDWVITRVEKLLDARKGPVSEMNYLDVIDPQDADFDLDKSASLYALPGTVLKEIYHVSGYMHAAEPAFHESLRQVKLESSSSVSNQTAIYQQISKKRPTIIRQTSIVSNLLQFFSEQTTTKDLFTPGEKSTKFVNVGDGEPNKFLLSTFIVPTEKAAEYKIVLKNGLELAGSMGYQKDLIKATIDIYKGTQNLEKINLERLIWEHPSLGFLKIERTKNNRTEIIDYRNANPEVKRVFNNLINDILKPIGDLYNLGLLTENLGGGVKRQMSVNDMIHKYEQILGNIRFGGLRKNEKGEWVPNELNGLSNELLKFLGDNNFKGDMTFNMSENPLIKALSSLREQSKEYLAPIPHDTTLGEVLLGKSRTSDSITKAVLEIIGDERRMAQMSSVSYKISNIKDTLAELKRFKKLDSSSGKYWQEQLDIHTALLGEFNTRINDPQVIYDYKKQQGSRGGFKTYDSPRGAIAKEVTAVYGITADGKAYLRGGKVFHEGEKIYWKKGDVVVANPKRIEAGNPHVSRARHASHDAFGRILFGVSKNDYQRIEKLYQEYTIKMNNLDIIDKKAPRDSYRSGILSEGQLKVLADHILLAEQLSATKGDLMVEQFLFRVMTPNPQKNTFEMSGWDPVRKQNSYTLKFASNKRNERIVLQFLQRAIDRQAETIMDQGRAKSLYDVINNRFKAAYVRQWDKTLQGDMFHFEKNTRSVDDFGFISPVDALPRFVFEQNLNEQARDVLQGFLNGTYYLDPVEVYRLTIGLGEGSLGQSPSVDIISKRIKYLWEGTEGISIGRTNEIYKPKQIIRNATEQNKEQVNRIEDMKSTDALKEIWHECF